MTKKKILIEPISELISEEPKQTEDMPETPIEQQSEEKTESNQKPSKNKMITCQHCNKKMLEKTFKYYHSLKCSPSTEQKNETPLVEFGFNRNINGKTSKYDNLFSHAF